MSESPVDFKRKAVDPIACLKAGWQLVRDQYWLFVGITLVAILLNGIVPFCILLGPMMCGVYLCLFRRQQNELVEFGTLFKGFDYFGASLIATLLHLIPGLIIVLPIFTLIILTPVLIVPLQQGRQSNPTVIILFVALAAILGMLLFCIVVVLNVACTFVYPLIVDRNLSGVAAVKLSAKAGFANFWQIIGLLFLNAMLGLAGVLSCYVGLFLVLPVSFGSVSIAYRQVFGLGRIQSVSTPPIFSQNL